LLKIYIYFISFSRLKRKNLSD